MTQILTLQPSALVSGYPTLGGLSLGGGAVSYVAAVNDASDATYIEGDNTQGGYIAFTFPDPTSLLPAGGWLIESLQLKLRVLSDAAAYASGQYSPWWWSSYVANGDGFGAGTGLHGKTLTIYDTQNLSAGATIQDRYTNLVTYLDDGSHVRNMNPINQAVVLGTIPTSAGYHRLYKVELLVRYNSLPVVTIGSNPADPSSTSRPLVEWSVVDDDGEAQQGFRIIVVEEGTPSTSWPYGIPGVDNPLYEPMGATTKAWDSGQWYSSATSMQVGSGLENGKTYWVYVRTNAPNAAGVAQTSHWGQKEFTITATGPADPVLTVTSEPTLSRNHIVVRESTTATPHPALYTVERYYEPLELFEPVRGGTYTSAALGFRTPSAGIFSGWYTLNDSTRHAFLSNGFIARWRGTLVDYTYSADQTFLSKALTSGNKLQFVFGIRTDGKLHLKWSNAGATFEQTAVSTVAAGGTDGEEVTFEVRCSFDTNPWTVSFWRSLDGGETFLQIGTTVTGAGPIAMYYSDHRLAVGGYDNFLWDQMNGLTAEVHLWKKDGSVLLANPKFEGLAANTTEFLDSTGETWTFNGGANGYLEMGLDIYDYEAPNGIPVTYEVLAWRDDTDIVAGNWVGSTPATNTLPGTVWHLKDPIEPENNLVVSVVSIQETMAKPITIAQPITTTDVHGLRKNVVSHTGPRGSTLDVVLRSLDKDTFDLMLALWRGGRTLLLQNIHGRQWYVQPGPIDLSLVKATPTAGEAWPLRHAYEWAGTLYEVDAPYDSTAGTI